MNNLKILETLGKKIPTILVWLPRDTIDLITTLHMWPAVFNLYLIN